MAVLSDYTSGTITLANGSTAVTGTGTLFDVAKFREGDTLQIQNLTAVIASVDSNTSLTLTAPWTGTSLTDASYRARYLPDGARVTAQATTLIELLGNGVLSNLAELGVEDGKVPVGNAAGEYELKDYLEDPNGTLAKFAALTLAANKAVTTDGSGNAQQIDLGTLGRALLALAAGTSAQIIQADGEIIDKASLPVSTAMQAALNNKFNVSGGTINGDVRANGAIYNYTTFTGGNQYGLAHISFIGDQIAMRMLAEHAPGQYYGGLIQVSFPSGSREFYYKSDGSFTAFGPIIGSVKNFEIDHPVDPDHYDLRHCSTEAPEMLVEYRGTAQLVNGSATINVEEYFGVMPGTFDALWADAWVTALQNQDSFDRLKPSRVEGAVFTIICENQNSNDLVSWVVMARRNDAYVRWDGCKSTDANGKLIIEFEKESV
ncbi:hypothetical protein [Ochrobactrum quorumnocens]|uniref:hypothetical protein n=1 Tax=Ochrobactrum quorumnocens TaxID=271865 RepID=UPI00178215AE|nr:hypothetical protein [[Ochrobactrum] quorumnocens]